MTYSGTACQSVASPTVTLASNFYQPGDQIVYTLTILNKGSIDGNIESITVDNVARTSSYTVTKGNIIYTVSMPTSNSLAASTGSTTMTVTAKFQNTSNISNYTENETQTITIGLNATQGSGSDSSSEGDVALADVISASLTYSSNTAILTIEPTVNASLQVDWYTNNANCGNEMSTATLVKTNILTANSTTDSYISDEDCITYFAVISDSNGKYSGVVKSNAVYLSGIAGGGTCEPCTPVRPPQLGSS